MCELLPQILAVYDWYSQLLRPRDGLINRRDVKEIKRVSISKKLCLISRCSVLNGGGFIFDFQGN